MSSLKDYSRRELNTNHGHMLFHRLLIGFVLFVVLVGCSTIRTNNTTSIATQFSQSASEFENGFERFPTITAIPSFTPPPGATAHQTQTVFNQAVYDATQSVVQTKVAQFPRVCKENYSRPKFSPNDLWMEELCYSESDHDLVLTLSNRQTQVLWKLLYHDYIPDQDFADGGMLVIHWSKDGRYAYFTSHLGGSVGECFYDGWDTGSGLFRLDLQNGQTKATLPLGNNLVWYGFSISSTDRRLVYGIRAIDLKILDLSTGQSINVGHEKDFSQGGGYLWSSDGLGFVYSTVTYKPDYGRESYSLRIVDARSGNEQILLESTEDCFDPVSWIKENILIVERYDKNYDQTLIEFDLNSNNITRETIPTP